MASTNDGAPAQTISGSAAISSPDGTSEWATPRWLIEAVQARWNRVLTLDVCATRENAVCSEYIDKERDGLKSSWWPQRGSLVNTAWCNPPYGRGEVEKWVAKAIAESAEHRRLTVVMLLPAKTDTAWWHDLIVRHARRIVFLRGRIKFDGPKVGTPTFASALVIFRGGLRCECCGSGLVVEWWDPRRPVVEVVAPTALATV